MRRNTGWARWASGARPLTFCLIAVAFALQGAQVVREQSTSGVPLATVWFALGIVTLLLGIWGTYCRYSLPPVPRHDPPSEGISPVVRERSENRASGVGSAGGPLPHPRSLTPDPQPPDSVFSGLARYGDPSGAWRWLLTALAVAAGVLSMQLLRTDSLSTLGSLLYLGSMALLLVAWVGDRSAERAEAPIPVPPDPEATTDWRLRRWVEVGVVVVMCALALGLRLYGLDNVRWSIDGDEGEAAGDAFHILDGAVVSPFGTGWYGQPNVYYWSVAIGLKLFGLNLFGLRMPAVLFSLLAFPFFYLLVRLLFGVRAAFIATGLLVANTIFLHYSRVQFSNITTPVFWVVGFYFLMRGLQTRRTLDFVLGGYAAFFSLYFYNGARIIPFIVGGLFLYLALLQRGFLKTYFRHLVVFGIAAFLISAPFLGYYLDHQQEQTSRSKEKLIYNQLVEMRNQYGDPVPLVLPANMQFMPSPEIYYTWRQLVTTLSEFTYREPGDPIYAFTGAPIINVLESALLPLGLAMSVWRWRDPRFALLLLWFWGPVLAGGVLTINAPYTPRQVGMFPTLAIFFMLVPNKIAAEWVALWRSANFGLGAEGGPKIQNRKSKIRKSLAAASVPAVVLLVLWLDFRNASDLFTRYLPHFTSSIAVAQNYLVEQMGQNRKVFEIGEFRSLDLRYGSTKFLERSLSIDGRDMLNPGNDLPFRDNSNKDVLVFVDNRMLAHLAPLRAFYPQGEQQRFLPDGVGDWFSYYTVGQDQIAGKQTVNVTYRSAGDRSGTGKKTALATGIGTRFRLPPPGMSYPLAAEWSGGLYAPDYAIYNFRLEAPAHTTLRIDGRPVLTATAQPPNEGQVVLARGLHSFDLNSVLADERSPAILQWRIGNEPWSVPKGRYLWNGPVGGLLTDVYPAAPEASQAALDRRLEANSIPQVTPVSRRVDSVIDFRDPLGMFDADPAHLNNLGIPAPGPLTARWRGDFVASATGVYTFETFSDGESGVWIDNNPVVLNTGAQPRSPTTIGGTLPLRAGKHNIEVRYNWIKGDGAMVLFVTPPGSERAVANISMFDPVPAVWLPGEVPEPPKSKVRLSDSEINGK